MRKKCNAFRISLQKKMLKKIKNMKKCEKMKNMKSLKIYKNIYKTNENHCFYYVFI